MQQQQRVQQHSPSPVQKEQLRERQISPEEQAQLDQVGLKFEIVPISPLIDENEVDRRVVNNSEK